MTNIEHIVEQFVIDCFEHGNSDCEWIYTLVEDKPIKKSSNALTLATLTGLSQEEVKAIAKRALERHAIEVRKAVHLQREMDGLSGVTF